MARRRVIKAHVAKGSIPGIDGGETLISSRDAAAVQAERRRAARRIGATTGSERAQDATLRAHGVPVFDRRAGLSELGTYLARARGR